MDPYQTPKSSEKEEKEAIPPKKLGPRCPNCGSADTSVDSPIRPKPSILGVIFFGWIFLLIKGAFAMRTSLCRACGATNRYKSAGSWVALAFLAFIVFIIALGIYDEYRS